jgi:hypothetical protein
MIKNVRYSLGRLIVPKLAKIAIKETLMTLTSLISWAIMKKLEYWREMLVSKWLC